MNNESVFILQKGKMIRSKGSALEGYACRRYWSSTLVEKPDMIFGLLKTLSLLDPIMVTFDEYEGGHNVEIEFYFSTENNFMILDNRPCSIRLKPSYFEQLKNLFEIEEKDVFELEAAKSVSTK